MCSVCGQVVSFDRNENPTGLCGNDNCKTELQRCGNFAPNAICSRLIPTTGKTNSLCDYCRTTTVIPDLAVAGNVEKWRRLENAKHRVLHQLDQIGFAFRDTSGGNVPELSFEFKADGGTPVLTGHNQGQIVINIKEADSVQRERSRVEFGEPHRTLVGHFRHELGHFFWDRLIKNDNERLRGFRNLFGDETNQSYNDALESFYQAGPPSGWQNSFVSTYAAMHPWEDFAETFATYLDVRAVVDNANHFLSMQVPPDDFNALLNCHCKVGMMANELNRDMGLLDLVPQVFVEPVAEKLKFVHGLKNI